MDKKRIPRIDWLDPIKAFALFGVILNHLVEELKPGPWFPRPTGSWVGFLERMPSFITHDSLLVSIMKLLAWVGDFSPGVFILASGFGLAWTILNSEQGNIDWKSFLQRRILRLFPLYIFLHLLFLAATLAKNGSAITFADTNILLSMLGIRTTDALFFYINPSWWFIWLILQLYVVFPLLYILLKRLGIGKFLLFACLFTFLSRLSGLFGFRYSESLYYWMLGIFFGTRLAEFCLGMALAALLKEGAQGRVQQLGEPKYIFLFSIPILFLGLAFSFVKYGSLIDYFLVTLGLSGFFYFVWKTVFEKRKLLSRFITMLGFESYGIYLVHQLILQRVGKLLGEDWRLIGLVVVIIASIPIGIYLNRLVNLFIRKMWELSLQERTIGLSVFLWVLSIVTLVAAALIGRSTPDAFSYRFLAFVAGGGLILLLMWDAVYPGDSRLLECMLYRLGICFSTLTLFFIPQVSVKIRLLLAMSVTVLSCYLYLRSKKKLQSWVFGILGTIILIIGMEAVLLYANPIETNHWGELPALQEHPTRTYSLKPNQRIHLKYNNYDYYVNTNSLGLNSPEVVLEKKSEDTIRILVVGDAFSMPEGMGFEDGYPALLEKEISKVISPRQVQVINAGVTGYGPTEEYPQLKELLPLVKPDIVVYEFFIDEFGQVGSNSQEKLASIGLGSSDEETSFDNLLQRSQVSGHLDKVFDSIRETLTGTPSDWRYEKSLLRFYETGASRAYYSRENLALIQSHLAAMNEVCQDFDATLVIYFVPAAVEVSEPSDIAYFPSDQDLLDKSRFDLDRPYANLVKIADELKIQTVNLKEPLKQNPNQPVYFPDSWHWNQEGHRTVAKFIALDIERRGLLTSFTSP